MHVTWKIEPGSTGEAEVPDPQAASELITDVILDTFPDEAPMTRAHLMLHIAAPLHRRIISEGAEAVRRGEEWTAKEGPVRVTLRPFRRSE